MKRSFEQEQTDQAKQLEAAKAREDREAQRRYERALQEQTGVRSSQTLVNVLEKGDQISHLPPVTYLGMAFGAFVSATSGRDLIKGKNRAASAAKFTFGIALLGVNFH